MYDVIIHGGGMAGATLALAIASSIDTPLRIAIIERQLPNQHQQSGFDARCIALSQGTCQRFNRILLANKRTLWQDIQPFSTPIKQIHVSDQGHAGIVQFNAQEFHLEALGAVVELGKMGQLLLQKVQQQPSIDYICPDEIIAVQTTTEYIEVKLKSQTTLMGKLLVGADGYPSQVAKLTHIPQPIIAEYQQTAIITNIQLQQFHQYRAFERFTSQGPLALLPLADNLMTLVWCVRQVEDLMTISDNSFLMRLQREFGWRLGKFSQCSKRIAYPLRLVKAEQYIQPRVALIGNAAQTLHPIAGQGFNLGIRDVLALAENIKQSYLQQADIGQFSQLQSYAQQRQRDQNNIMQLTDGLVSIFANNLLPMTIGRNLGLFALAQSSLLRQYFAKSTLGWV